MKTSESKKDESKQGKPENKGGGGNKVPDIRTVPKASKTDPKDPGNDAGGIKPRASGRQGSIDVQDGGQDTGSSAGSH